MSKPKLLRIFDESTTDSAHSKFNNPVKVTKSGKNLVVSESIKVHNNAILTFKAPCSCEGISGIIINGIVHDLVDAHGDVISDSGAFIEGVVVSITLDTTTNKAFIVNAASLPGTGTKVANPGQAVTGEYNEVDPDALFIVGNGTSDGDRSNAATVYRDRTVIKSSPDPSVKCVRNILAGTSIPDSSIGDDGDIYIMFEEE